jgi:YidC/Oxa1 family membrane protein insertase
MDNRPAFDKKSIAIGVVFIVLFIAWPTIMNTLWPPPPKPVAPPQAARATNQIAEATSVVAQPATPPSPAATTNVAEATKPVAQTPGAPKPPEQTSTLENEFIRVEFTSYGGGISRVVLAKHKEDVGDPDLVTLNRFAKAPVGQISGMDGFDSETTYTMTRTASSVTFEAVNDAGVKLTKEFRLAGDFRIEGVFALENRGNAPLKQTRIEIAMGTATAMVPTDTFDMPYLGWGDGKKSEFVDASSFEKSWWARRDARSVVRYEDVMLTWTGLEDRFFCLLWMPQNATNSLSATRKLVQHPGHVLDPHKPRPTDWAIDAQLISAPFDLKAGETYQYPFQIYAGPKEYGRLQALGKGQTAVMHWGYIEWMAELLLKFMNLLHRGVPSYFWVIVIVTILIKLLFWPLTAISNRNMKAMQALSPKMTALREKYKADPQKMNAEVMKLYRENKVNPMAGCLPTLVQIPVFIGLYYMLRSAIELRGHGFLWIHDLSQPDTIAHLGGFAVNPLPVVMTATMIWQMKMTPTGGDPMQQKMMMLMPLMFLFFFYGTPSGLVVYWTVQNIFTIIQMAMTKHHAAAPASTATSSGPPPKPETRTKVKSR